MERYKVGDLVWAKMKGFSPWPGRISNPIGNLKNPSKADMYYIFFFGTKNFAWINEANIKPYLSHKDKFMKRNKSASFKKAIKHIEIYIKYYNDVQVAEESRSETRKEELITSSNTDTEETNNELVIKHDPRKLDDYHVNVESDREPVRNKNIEGIHFLVSNVEILEIKKELHLELDKEEIDDHSVEMKSIKDAEQEEKVELIPPLVLENNSEEIKKNLEENLVPIKIENHQSENSECSSEYMDLDMQHGRTSQLVKPYTNDAFECKTPGSSKEGLDLIDDDERISLNKHILKNIKKECEDFESSECAYEDTKGNIDTMKHSIGKSLSDKSLLFSSSLDAQSTKIEGDKKLVMSGYNDMSNLNSVKEEIDYKISKNDSVEKCKCSDCNKRLTDKRSSKDHYNAHREIRSWSCSDCDKRFTKRNALLCHLRMRHPTYMANSFSYSRVKIFSCAECSKTFIKKRQLEYHMIVHVGIKNYKCNFCKKKFMKKTNLMSHLAVHKGSKDFVFRVIKSLL